MYDSPERSNKQVDGCIHYSPISITRFSSPVAEYLYNASSLRESESLDKENGTYSLSRLRYLGRMIEISLSFECIPDELLAEANSNSASDIQSFGFSNCKKLAYTICQLSRRHDLDQTQDGLYIAYVAATLCQTLSQYFQPQAALDEIRTLMNTLSVLFGLDKIKYLAGADANRVRLDSDLIAPPVRAIYLIALTSYAAASALAGSNEHLNIKINYQFEQVAALRRWLDELHDIDAKSIIFPGNYDKSRMISLIAEDYFTCTILLAYELRSLGRINEVVKLVTPIKELVGCLTTETTLDIINHMAQIGQDILDSGDEVNGLKVFCEARALCRSDMGEFGTRLFQLGLQIRACYERFEQEAAVIGRLYLDIDSLSSGQVLDLAPEVAFVMNKKVQVLVASRDVGLYYYENDDLMSGAEEILLGIEKLADIRPKVAVYIELIEAKIIVVQEYIQTSLDNDQTVKLLCSALSDFYIMWKLTVAKDFEIIPQVTGALFEVVASVRDMLLQRKARETLQNIYHDINDLLKTNDCQEDGKEQLLVFQVQVLTLLAGAEITAMSRPRERSLESIQSAEAILIENGHLDHNKDLLEGILYTKHNIYVCFGDFQAASAVETQIRTLRGDSESN